MKKKPKTGSQRKKDYLSTQLRKNKRALWIFVEQGVYNDLKAEAEAQRPSVKPGPLAAEILRRRYANESSV